MKILERCKLLLYKIKYRKEFKSLDVPTPRGYAVSDCVEKRGLDKKVNETLKIEEIKLVIQEAGLNIHPDNISKNKDIKNEIFADKEEWVMSFKLSNFVTQQKAYNDYRQLKRTFEKIDNGTILLEKKNKFITRVKCSDFNSIVILSLQGDTRIFFQTDSQYENEAMELIEKLGY